MVSLNLPFEPREVEDQHGEDLFKCPFFRTLPQPLQEGTQGHPHLLEYLHMLPVEELGLPEYKETLSRKDGDIKLPNIIYPVGSGIFTHICADEEDARDHYISIEPSLTIELGDMMTRVEERLLDFFGVLDDVKTDEEKKEALLYCVDKICSLETKNPFRSGAGLFGFLTKKSAGHERIRVTPQELRAVKHFLVRDKVGLGVLQPMVLDSYIEDISCSGLGPIFIEHKTFKALKSALTFNEMEELDRFVLRLAERIKKPATYRNPIVGAVLPDGSRINIVYGGDVSKRGSNFTIRKFSETPLSIMELCEFGSVDYHMAAYLWMVLGEGMNMFVCGETASGKTTLMNAVTTFIEPSAKIVTIEDTPELQIPHPNWIREVVRSTKVEAGSGITMFDLLKAALRQRPNAILIGEIRGEEAAVAFQGMQTGHQTMATFHAASVQKLIQRLTGDPIFIPKTYIDNLNIVVIQNSVRLPGGRVGRRATSINEIVGYDPPSESFSFIEVFRWNPVTDKFDFVGKGNSYMLENKIAFKRGIPNEKRRIIYKDLERRAKVLEKIHKSGTTGFYEVLKVLAAVQRQGIV